MKSKSTIGISFHEISMASSFQQNNINHPSNLMTQVRNDNYHISKSELWWKALDFASLERSSVSFFKVDHDHQKPETAASRWARARTRAAKVGKGLSKDEKAQKLALRHWLEAIDPRHRYGHNLQYYYDVWLRSESTQPFFYWVDVGEGREINLDKCSRVDLQSQCIKYLGPKEREAYEVIVKNGRLVYKQSQKPVSTTQACKWIFVLSTSRVLYVGQKKKGTFQHSSFLAGAATTAAGRLVVVEGVLKAIWPYSGHYLPTEENFKEFIVFLQHNNVDLSDVKRCSIGEEDEYPSLRKCSEEVEVKAKTTTTIEVSSLHKKSSKQENDCAKALELRKCLSFKWNRPGRLRDCPAELQFKALEHVNLSPRFAPSINGNKIPISSPRPISLMHRLSSPRLHCMAVPSSTASLTLPNHTIII